MAVVTRLSVQVTNRDAVPRVANNSAVQGAHLRFGVGKVLTVATDSINSIYIFFSIPSNAVMSSLRVFSQDIGSSAAAADVGLYQTTKNGSAVVDADFFKAALNLNAGALNGTEILHDNVISLDKAEQRIWEHLGLTVDSKRDYDVCMTATGAIDAVANIVLKGSWAQ